MILCAEKMETTLTSSDVQRAATNRASRSDWSAPVARDWRVHLILGRSERSREREDQNNVPHSIKIH